MSKTLPCRRVALAQYLMGMTGLASIPPDRTLMMAIGTGSRILAEYAALDSNQ